jgi:hypothetical protein
MRKILLALLAMLSLVGSASAQTLLHEGRGAILSTTPATLVVPTNGFGSSDFGYNANASYSHRLSSRFDVTGTLGYSSQTVTAGAAVGYTNRFSASDWGLRWRAGITTFKRLEGGGELVGAGNVSAMLFREVDLSSVVEILPNVGVRSDISDVNFLLSANVGLPVYVKVLRDVRLFASPSYGVNLVSRFNFPRNVSIGFGAQLNL